MPHFTNVWYHFATHLTQFYNFHIIFHFYNLKMSHIPTLIFMMTKGFLGLRRRGFPTAFYYYLCINMRLYFKGFNPLLASSVLKRVL